MRSWWWNRLRWGKFRESFDIILKRKKKNSVSAPPDFQSQKFNDLIGQNFPYWISFNLKNHYKIVSNELLGVLQDVQLFSVDLNQDLNGQTCQKSSSSEKKSTQNHRVKAEFSFNLSVLSHDVWRRSTKKNPWPSKIFYNSVNNYRISFIYEAKERSFQIHKISTLKIINFPEIISQNHTKAGSSSMFELPARILGQKHL